MAETIFAELSAWAGLLHPGSFGSAAREAGVVIGEPPRGATALLTARNGRAADLLSAARAVGLDLPVLPLWVRHGALAILWAGPGQWSVRGPGDYAAIEAEFAALAAYGVLIDQSHARALLVVSGPRARDALAKGLDIDLHPRAFRKGDVALTQAVHISAHIRQLDDRPAYEIAVPRSFAGSFWRWLSESAAEYGYVVGGASVAHEKA